MAEEDIANTADKEEIDKYIRSLYDKWAEDNKPQPIIPEEEQIRERHRLIRETVEPVLGPDIREARLAAQDAKDQIRFYRNNPDAIDVEGEIEKTFEDMMKRGNPFSRQDIYDHMVGRMAREQPDKFEERKKSQLEKAQSAADLGSGNGKSKNDMSTEDFRNLPLEEKEKALAGMVF